MAKMYTTIAEPGYSEVEEKKSRFLAEALFVDSEDAAVKELDRIRKLHYDARHHCYAWIMGENSNVKKAADDGEPSGTAGQPILKVLEGENLTNVLVVVTRYFGGTLLGTGGLSRAYSQAASRAVRQAKTAVVRECTALKITLDYSMLDKVTYFLRKENRYISEETYTDKVSFLCTIPSEDEEYLRDKITSLTGAAAAVETAEKGYMRLPE